MCIYMYIRVCVRSKTRSKETQTTFTFSSSSEFKYKCAFLSPLPSSEPSIRKQRHFGRYCPHSVDSRRHTPFPSSNLTL